MNSTELQELRFALKAAAQKYGLGVGQISVCDRNSPPLITAARDHAMMILHDRRGWTFRAIGAAMQCGENAASSGASRARARVKAAKDATKRRLTTQDLKLVVELNHVCGKGIGHIAGVLHCGVSTLVRECNRAGIELRRGRPGHAPGKPISCGDPRGNDEIGTLPPDHPLYAVDQAIMRARNTKHRAVGGWRQSSLADIA